MLSFPEGTVILYGEDPLVSLGLLVVSGISSSSNVEPSSLLERTSSGHVCY